VDGYRIERFTSHGSPGETAVIEFWRREGIELREREGRRVHEVLFVGLGPSGELAAECSVYLQRVARLRLDLWFLRVYTGREHRMSDLAAGLARAAHDHLDAHFANGEDVRGSGLAFEIENPGLSTRVHAVWPLTGAVFLGLTEQGNHLRVNYFQGARAPEPAA
jgi:hypothetical protein